MTTATVGTSTASAASAARPDFGDYVAARRPHLLGSARRITRNPDTAEDLLHSALVNVLPLWSGILDHRAADAYVRRAMTNQHAAWFRQRWRRNEDVTADLPERPDRWSTGAAFAAAQSLELWTLVKTLPPGQRSIIVLRFYEDLSVAETADALGCSTGTVKCQTSRALAKLRRMLDPHDPAVPVPE